MKGREKQLCVCLLFPSILLSEKSPQSGLAPNCLFNLTAILFVPVSAARRRVSHGSRSGLTSPNGNHGNAGRGLPVTHPDKDWRSFCFGVGVFFVGTGSEVRTTRRTAKVVRAKKHRKLFFSQKKKKSNPNLERCLLLPGCGFVHTGVDYCLCICQYRLVCVCVRARARDRQLNLQPNQQCPAFQDSNLTSPPPR